MLLLDLFDFNDFVFFFNLFLSASIFYFSISVTLKHLYLYVLRVSVQLCVGVCHGTHVDIRTTSSQISSFAK